MTRAAAEPPVIFFEAPVLEAGVALRLETRVPFLDHELVELAARIPAELKVRDGGKAIIKKHSIYDRPGRTAPWWRARR